MAKNEKRILEMLANNEIDVDEAARLLSVLETDRSASGGTAEAGTTTRVKPRYLRVMVRPGVGHEHDEDAESVNVRVPMSLIRSGIRLTSLIPDEARDKVNGALREKGVDFDMCNLKPEDLEEIIEALSELEVDVASASEVVKVFVE